MGLPRDFLDMLTAPVVLKRATTKDQWGNEGYGADENHMAFIDEGSSAWGTERPTDQQQGQSVTTANVMMDAIGVEVGDKLIYDGKDHWANGVATAKDEFGDDLYQMVSVTDTKEG